MNYKQTAAREFAERIKALGFDVYLAERGEYGIITDDTGSRVMSFSFTDFSLSGNYGPPSRQSGTGWRLEQAPSDLQTADDVRKALYMPAPGWCLKGPNGWQHYTTLEQHLKTYGWSSRYEKV